jgi:hypothetical protein
MLLVSIVDSLKNVLGNSDGLLKVALARTDSLMAVVPGAVIGVAAPLDTGWYEKALIQTLIGGAMALLGGLIVEGWRNRSERERMKQRLIRRIRGALETCAITARSLARNKNEQNEINPETMNAIILEWQRYDRVSDDIGLLKDPRMEEDVDNILGHARMVAEAVLEDERRFKGTVRELGERQPKAIGVDQSVIDRIHRQRRQRLDQIKGMGEKAQGALDRFNAKWKHAEWHEERQVPETPEAKVGDVP